MSAAPAVFPATGPGLAGTGRGARPPHLRLVRPGEPAPQARPVTAPRPGRRSGRLTRRVRLALTLSTMLAVALATALTAGLLVPAGAAPGEQTVVVQPGQTLSQIAAEELPDLPLDRAVVEIQLANRLSTSQVAAGQELVVPGP